MLLKARVGGDFKRRTDVAPVSICKFFAQHSVARVGTRKLRTQGGKAKVRDKRDACPTDRFGRQPGRTRGPVQTAVTLVGSHLNEDGSALHPMDARLWCSFWFLQGR